MSDKNSVILQLKGLTKRYGSVTVLDDCDIAFRSGQIHAIVGANGAGKSTLVQMIAGMQSPSRGEMRLHGRSFLPTSRLDAENLGVSIVHQELSLVSTLSVAENLYLNRLPSRMGVLLRGRLREAARRAMNRVGLEAVDVDAPLGALGIGHQQMVEIAAALDRDCQVLILDEPTAALSAAEADRLFGQLAQLRQQGVCILYISHRLDEIDRIADRVTVLRDGECVVTKETGGWDRQQLLAWMDGLQSSAAEVAFVSHRQDQVLLRVSNLSGGPVQNASLELHRGERLGIAGLVGSGRTELLRLIFGADLPTGGSVTVGQWRDQVFRSPSTAVKAGLGMVTEDRKQSGLLLMQSIRENIALPSLSELAWLGVTQRAKESGATLKLSQQLNVKHSLVEQPVVELSGGNQQKVAIAKWLQKDAQILLFDEPTRGIDVGARQRIYRLLEELASQGKGLLIVSSDSEELLEVCDRVLVMSNGRLVEELHRGSWSSEQVMQAAFLGYLGQSQEKGEHA